MREGPSQPNQLLMDPAVNTVALGIKLPTHDLGDKLEPYIALDTTSNNNVTQYYFCETGIITRTYLSG